MARIPVVIFQLTEITRHCFQQIQSLCVLDFSISLIPVSNVEQIPQLLERFKVSSKIKNPFKIDRNPSMNVDKEMLLVLLKVPDVGEKTARTLLDKFGTVRGVASASEAELTRAVGARLARGLHNYFNRKNYI
eukprot:TRINITY_DN37991_c0_g1_i1.p1 TRINITY_DN37991_c0_g1~~TRINITY_DN37991_c0_g1_i1.p1  ORF type:complete len:133 (-),score=7.09 TRINITY_DN37991_c0_g1_i1:224-622(-)